MFPLDVQIYLPIGSDRREVHEWAEQQGYFHYSYHNPRFKYDTYFVIKCYWCGHAPSVEKSNPESCTCESAFCSYHFGTCPECYGTIEFSHYDMREIKNNNMIIVSKKPITTRRAKSGLLRHYDMLMPCWERRLF